MKGPETGGPAPECAGPLRLSVDPAAGVRGAAQDRNLIAHGPKAPDVRGDRSQVLVREVREDWITDGEQLDVALLIRRERLHLL